jgi:hypothetical protein
VLPPLQLAKASTLTAVERHFVQERDPGRLLREEKMRKLLDKKLPQIEAEIARRLGDWETESGKVFMYEGKSYLEMLQLQLATTNSKIKKRKPLGERDVRGKPRLLSRPIACARPAVLLLIPFVSRLDLASNQSSTQQSTPSKIAPPRTPRAGVKADLNGTRTETRESIGARTRTHATGASKLRYIFFFTCLQPRSVREPRPAVALRP